MNKKSINNGIGEVISNNSRYIYPILFYLAGLFIGTLLYKNTNFDTADLFGNILKTDTDFSHLFINRLSLYLSIFIITAALGAFVIGYPVTALVPLLNGAVIAFRISYFYLTYNAKGIGYALILIIPQTALIESILIYTVVNSSELSKRLLNIVKKKNMPEDFTLKAYFKKYLIYLVAVILTALTNSAIVYFLEAVISL